MQIELVDIPPEELLKRLKEGKVYLGPQSEIAARNFFQEDRLTALREIALRFTAEKVDHDLHLLQLSSKEFGKGWKTTERLLVAISASPYSQQLIRTARRIAFNLDAPWIALYVDTGVPMSDEERNRLSTHLNLARDLGAEVITVSDPDVVRTIDRVAKQRDVTQIIIGRPIKNFLRELWEGGSLLDRLTATVRDIDIHVIRQAPIPGIKGRKLFTWRAVSLMPYWKAALFVLGIAMIGHFTKEFVGYQSVGFLFLLGMILLGLVAERGTLYFSALFSAVIWYFYFVPYEARANQAIIQDSILVASLFVSAIILGNLAKRLKTSELLLHGHEEKTQAVYEIIKEIANAQSSKELLKGIENRLGRILQGTCEIVMADNQGSLIFDPSQKLLNDEKEKAVAIWVYNNGKAAGWSTDTLPLVQNLYIPMKSYNVIVGVIVYQPKFGRKLFMEEINLLHNVAQQIGNYLWRTSMEEKAIKAEYLGKIEKIHYAILKSLSFQPQASTEPKEPETHEVPRLPKSAEKPVHLIQESSDNLQRLVESLLTMTKLSTGFFAVNKKLVSVYELVDACQNNLQHFLLRHHLDLDIARDIPLVMIDFSLFELLICNLLMNAAETSPPGSTIYLTIQPVEKKLRFSVADESSGIPDEALAMIFDKFYPSATAGSAAGGLGLAIAKNITDVHQGTIRAQNRPVGGAEIIVEIPLP